MSEIESDFQECQVEYFYDDSVGITRRCLARQLLRENSLRNLERMKGTVINGYLIDAVEIDDRNTPCPKIRVTGHKAVGGKEA